MIALPPSDAGAVNETEPEATPDDALTPVGVPGTVAALGLMN